MTEKPSPRPRAAPAPGPRGASAREAPAGAGAGGARSSALRLRDWRAPYLLPGLLLIAGRALAWSQLRLGSEDAYITFRYARSLATGHGLVYNPGERVMGFSSPVWTVWNAIGELLIHDPLAWSRLTSIAADLVTLVALARLLERYAGRAAAWCFAFFFAAWPYFAAVSMSGMESAALLALIALSAALAARASPAAGPALGVLALTRPEGVVAAAVLATGARARDRVMALGLLALGSLALAWYYGSPIPQSVIAKSRLYGTPGPWEGRFWWDWLVPFKLGAWPSVGDLNLTVPLGVVWFAACLAGIGPLWRMRRSPLALAVAGCLVVWLGYALLGVAYFFWYLEVPLAGLAALAAVGLPHITRGRALYLACVLCVLGSWTIGRILYVGRAQSEEAAFAAVAETLRESSRPGEKVFLEPIGMVGYQNPLVVVDEVGLVSPRVAARRLAGPGWYYDLVAGERPDWLVVRRGVLRANVAFAGRGAPFRDIEERDSLLARYAELPGQPEGDATLVVLRRR